MAAAASAPRLAVSTRTAFEPSGARRRLLFDTGMPLVDPGDPENSWLYHPLANCEPTLTGGQVVSHMPKNAPKLLEDGLVAKLRGWIEAGALDD